MGLKERLNDEMKRAMKAKDKNRLSVIRMVRGDIRDKEINDRVEFDDDGVLEAIASQIKKRKDALGSVDISTEPYKSGDKAEKSKITDS